MTATCDSPLEVAKERLRIPALWVILTLPGRPGRSCRSPFREDRNPSFVIFDNDRRFYDHGTGQAGDAVDFLAMALGISNGDASRKLIELAGVIPQTPHFQREEKHGSGDEMAEKARKRESWPTFDAPTGAEVKAIANCGAYPLKGSHLPQKRACCGAPIAMRDKLGSSPIRGVSNAQARRMDGQLWAHIGSKKAWTLPGSTATHNHRCRRIPRPHPGRPIPWAEYESKLNPRCREIATLRQAHRANAPYEIHQHLSLLLTDKA
jgi:hypothetical protein